MIVSAAMLKNGIVYTGRRHSDVYREHRDKVDLKGAIQGFVTDTGKFLDRKEAGEYAFNCGQIPELTDCLFSEDLY